MEKRIKWGIIGLGKIAAKFAQDLLLSDTSSLHGVASRSLDKAQAFGEQYNSIKNYGSYEELAEDPEIDIVYIATPHVLHFENTMMCLKNGKSVLCEKPMGINAEEVRAMVEEARSRNLFLMEGIWTRFIPATEKLVELLNHKVIGNVHHLTADFGFRANFDPAGRLFNKNLGGGSLLDVGIYPIYFSLLALGQPVEVKAMARFAETDVDSYCSMIFSYDNDAMANLESSIESNTPIEGRIYGENGSIVLHSRFHHAQQITLLQGDKSEIFDIPYVGNGYYHEIEEANWCLLNGQSESSKVSLETSLNLIEIIDKVKLEIGLSYK